METIELRLKSGPPQLELHGGIWALPTSKYPSPVKPRVVVVRGEVTTVRLVRGSYRYYFVFGGQGSSSASFTLEARRLGTSPRVYSKSYNLTPAGTRALAFVA